MGVENGTKNDEHSTADPEDENGSEDIGGKHSAFPVIHLGPDGEELWEDGEPVKREEEEYIFYKLDRLAKQLDDAASLWSYARFFQSGNGGVAAIRKEEFRSRLESFLEKVAPHIDAPSPEVLNSLFQAAIQAQKQIAAWKNIVHAIKSDEFSRSVKCLRAEVARFDVIRKVLHFEPETPSWMSSWKRLWIEAFEELEEHIEAELRSARSYLESLSKLARLGRSETESHVLLMNRRRIREVIADTPLSKVPSVVLAAFAYAAQLVRSEDDANDAEGKYVDAIKRRITRAQRSKARMAISITVLMSQLDGPSSAQREIPPR